MMASPSLATAPRGAGPKKEKVYPVMSRREVEGLIADGKHIIIVNQYALRVDPWLQYHPGGDKAIKHMVGRDATDEVTALHSIEAREQMLRYRIGRIDHRWTNFVPPIQGGVFRPLCPDEAAKSKSAIEPEIKITSPTEHDDMRSSHASSREPSPVFDSPVLAAGDSELRKRTVGLAATDRSNSMSSISSVGDDGLDPGLSYLNTQTREKINIDLKAYPSLDDETQDNIVEKYRELNERIKAEGLYNCNYTAYAWEVSRYSLLFAGFLFFLHKGWYVPSSICLGVFWHQLVFTAHDAGHMGITHHFQVDTCIGIFIADFLGGLSIGWWKRNHNVHHIVTNSPEHDPDIEHMPFFAISHRFLLNLRSSYYERIMAYDFAAKFLLRFQAYSYYLILTLGRFNLYRLSWEFLILGLGPKKGPAWWHRWMEMVGQVVFWYWFGYGVLYCSIEGNWNRFVFVMISHAVTMPLHVQITLSHFAMSSAELGPAESFPQKMLRTTMDVDCPQWLDFFHGGLQFQAIHHLYPRIPRHNLRNTQRLVQEFCNDVGIPYALYGFVGGNKEVIGRLAEVSRQAAIFAECQKVVSKGEMGHY
ncbi:hypothetical protein MKZ38_007481 [Zalerion maritima]|uniref:Delta 8-(E)-sphingolipid desaturase n=1 Tax=Zalerion maritima TaxID=339359 RepID=A0AAD5RUR0_9PEZI|nr:hypothetical protein MKZ38_007481 [Zalerion maritima]